MQAFVSSRLGPSLIGCLVLGAAVLVALGCETSDEAVSAEAHYVEAGDSLPRIQFGDGQVSLNDRCMVRQIKLNLRMPPVYVNGRPVGFC